MRGRFITLEGGEGVGKSTQSRLLAERLRAAGRAVVLTREPGGTPGAESVRALLVSGEPDRWDGVAEALLVNAARADHVRRVIRPALARGEWVVCDRFIDSTLAYQGHARGGDIEALLGLHRFATGDLWPDLSLVLALPAETGVRRARAVNAGEQRFEQEAAVFHQRLTAGFAALVARFPERCVSIDADQPRQAVADAIDAVIASRWLVS